jgi:hypothetical protein
MVAKESPATEPSPSKEAKEHQLPSSVSEIFDQARSAAEKQDGADESGPDGPSRERKEEAGKDVD